MRVRMLGFAAVVVCTVIAYQIFCKEFDGQKPRNKIQETSKSSTTFPMNADGSITLGTSVGSDGVARSFVIPK